MAGWILPQTLPLPLLLLPLPLSLPLPSPPCLPLPRYIVIDPPPLPRYPAYMVIGKPLSVTKVAKDHPDFEATVDRGSTAGGIGHWRHCSMDVVHMIWPLGSSSTVDKKKSRAMDVHW